MASTTILNPNSGSSHLTPTTFLDPHHNAYHTHTLSSKPPSVKTTTSSHHTLSLFNFRPKLQPKRAASVQNFQAEDDAGREFRRVATEDVYTPRNGGGGGDQSSSSHNSNTRKNGVSKLLRMLKLDTMKWVRKRKGRESSAVPSLREEGGGDGSFLEGDRDVPSERRMSLVDSGHGDEDLAAALALSNGMRREKSKSPDIMDGSLFLPPQADVILPNSKITPSSIAIIDDPHASSLSPTSPTEEEIPTPTPTTTSEVEIRKQGRFTVYRQQSSSTPNPTGTKPPKSKRIFTFEKQASSPTFPSVSPTSSQISTLSDQTIPPTSPTSLSSSSYLNTTSTYPDVNILTTRSAEVYLSGGGKETKGGVRMGRKYLESEAERRRSEERERSESVATIPVESLRRLFYGPALPSSSSDVEVEDRPERRRLTVGAYPSASSKRTPSPLSSPMLSAVTHHSHTETRTSDSGSQKTHRSFGSFKSADGSSAGGGGDGQHELSVSTITSRSGRTFTLVRERSCGDLKEREAKEREREREDGRGSTAGSGKEGNGKEGKEVEKEKEKGGTGKGCNRFVVGE
ncbi:hypothetical protein HK097_001697 [Rhizophlyctis rosea]|uniref:Uncharacterized protein n=1 Tax=Rhizophlyctis rosea TaxID=64517 RepID=A0AAD5S455_9FUNG|nr:hypothetical protein HK097_001697 [Rhizophlyctis rosea]